MTNELLTREDLQHFRTQLLNELKEVLQQTNQTTKQWLKSSEVRKMLGISHGTLQNLRINRSLPYTKLGGIMFYKYEDIEKILEAGLPPPLPRAIQRHTKPRNLADLGFLIFSHPTKPSIFEQSQ